MTSAPALLPCPFCGGSPIREFDLNAQGGKQWWTTECDTCNCLMTESGICSEAEANAAWNRRAATTQADEYERGLRVAANAFNAAITEILLEYADSG